MDSRRQLATGELGEWIKWALGRDRMLRCMNERMQEGQSNDIVLRNSESEQFHGAPLKKRVKRKRVTASLPTELAMESKQLAEL